MSGLVRTTLISLQTTLQTFLYSRVVPIGAFVLPNAAFVLPIGDRLPSVLTAVQNSLPYKRVVCKELRLRAVSCLLFPLARNAH